jgi:hypothetical protein
MSSTSFFDAPGGIRKEGNNQTLVFTRNANRTSGILAWSPVPPSPATGCGTPSGHYAGGVLIGSTSPITQANKPKDGVCCYSADPTFDVMVFAGDMIGDARVLWSDNNDRMTGSVVVEGLDPNCSAYYFAFFAIDNTCRYNQDGIYSYSLDHGGEAIACTSGYVKISLNGARPTDNFPSTYDNSVNYPIKLRVDGNDVNLILDGSTMANYNDVVEQLNIAWKNTVPAYEGPHPQYYGQFFTNGSAWFQHDGSHYMEINPLLGATDPSVFQDGDLWFDSNSAKLNEYLTGQWSEVSDTIRVPFDPTLPVEGTYWWNGAIARRFDGNVWVAVDHTIQQTDPAITPVLTNNTIWQSAETAFSRWSSTRQCWKPATVLIYNGDPLSPNNGTLWYNPIDSTLRLWNGIDWISQTATISANLPVSPTANQLWINPLTNVVQRYNLLTGEWNTVEVIVYHKALDDVAGGDLHYTPLTSVLSTFDSVSNQWIDITSTILTGSTDPASVQTFDQDSVWINPTTNEIFKRSGTSWLLIHAIVSSDDPRSLTSGFWFNTATEMWYERNGGSWNQLNPVVSAADPTMPVVGTTWFDGTALFQRDTTTTWSAVPFETTASNNEIGDRWIDDNQTLRAWTAGGWTVVQPPYVASINEKDCIVLTSSSCGGESWVEIVEETLFTSALRLITDRPRPGNDGATGQPMYDVVGVGTDGSPDERRKVIDNLYMRLGAPTINVELTREQMDLAVQRALDFMRRDSGAGYKRGYFFLDLVPGQQHYVLTSKKVGFNKIVEVLYLYRPRGSFLNMTFGGGDIYGQQMLQQLYVSGTFDLLSYHLLASYQTLVSKLFATEFQFQWVERTRTLSIMRKIPRYEKILVDATIERTEQDLLTDRMTKNWIEEWALTEAKIMLGEKRGKYTSLPGAGGAISLNAESLKAEAIAKQDLLRKELEDFIASDIETWGLGVMMVKG